MTSQAGTHLLGRIAGRLGVAGGFSQALAGITSRSSAHDGGRVLTQLAMTIAAGGRCLSDLKTLRDQPVLFGRVASDATAWRAIHQIDDALVDELVAVRQGAARRLLEQAEPEQVELEVDATLLHLHSEDKEGAAARSRVGSGSHRCCASSSRWGCPPGCCGPVGRPRTMPPTS